MTKPDAHWISLAAAIELVRGAYGDDGIQSLIRRLRLGTIEIYLSADHYTPPPARFFEGFGSNYMEAAIADWKLDIWSLIETRLGFGNATDGFLECFDLIAGDFDATVHIGSTGEQFYHQIRGLRLNRLDIERVFELRGTITPIEGHEGASLIDQSGIEGGLEHQEKEIVTAPKRGRPTGSGAIDDSAMFKLMHEKLTSGEARSVHRAAQLVAEGAGGDGTLESKVERLRKNYKNYKPST